jgi:AraC-like DNA-binding protein
MSIRHDIINCPEIGWSLNLQASGGIVRAASFVNSYFSAWNHRDPKGVADHLAAEGVYCDIPLNRRRTHDELVTSLSEFFLHDRYQYELIGEIHSSRNSIAFQYRISSPGKDDATGSYCGAEFITLAGDSAMLITDYYDIPGVAQLRPSHRESEDDVLKPKYAKSGLSTEQLEEIKGRLEILMKSEKAFLRPDLTLPTLAQAVGCSVNHLSQVINSGLGVSFFDYLNRHRIEYAKSMLGNYAGHNNAILNVAFAVGFNSNSAFYAAFKKCIGQTPAQYRRAQIRKTH